MSQGLQVDHWDLIPVEVELTVISFRSVVTNIVKHCLTAHWKK